MTDPTEHLRLVKRAIRGNPDAYGQLIAGQQEYLYKMAFLYMRNQEDALDLVGSVVLKEVPPHATVVGIPGKVVRINGEKVADLEQEKCDPLAEELCKLRTKVFELEEELKKLKK